MIKVTLLSIALVFLSACSFKSPPNQWQYKSTSAFDSYTKNFLSSNDALAKNDLNRAIEHAKHSADLTMLSRIYLGKCALNISVGIKDSCQDYKNIAPLVNDKTLEAYYNFITLQLDSIQLLNLNNEYRDFASYIKLKQYSKADIQISKISRPTSKLLSASLMKNNLSSKTRKEILDLASFYGYKKSVLFWLKNIRDNTNDEIKRHNLSKKISILESK
jgi:aryl carrier-like protein